MTSIFPTVSFLSFFLTLALRTEISVREDVSLITASITVKEAACPRSCSTGERMLFYIRATQMIILQSSYRRARESPQIWQKNVARSYERPQMCDCVCCMRTVLNSTVGPAQSLHTWKNLQLLPPSHAFGSTKRPERIFNQGYHIFCNTRSLYPPLLCLLLPPLGFFSAAYSMPSILLHHRPPPHVQ